LGLLHNLEVISHTVKGKLDLEKNLQLLSSTDKASNLVVLTPKETPPEQTLSPLTREICFCWFFPFTLNKKRLENFLATKLHKLAQRCNVSSNDTAELFTPRSSCIIIINNCCVSSLFLSKNALPTNRFQFEACWGGDNYFLIINVLLHSRHVCICSLCIFAFFML
jgi:hypothetical protein